MTNAKKTGPSKSSSRTVAGSTAPPPPSPVPSDEPSEVIDKATLLKQKKDDRRAGLLSLFGIFAVVIAMRAMMVPSSKPSSVVENKPLAAPPKTAEVPTARPQQKASAGDLDDPSPEALVTKYLREADLNRRMAMKARDTENQMFTHPLDDNARVYPEQNRPLGVSMDQENTDQKVYEDLYGKEQHAPSSPEEKIEARLAQEQWVGQAERQDRKLFVQNFIKQAADAGYAIDLDENLVVVRVRKIKDKPLGTLDQVLDSIARKGY